LTKAQKYERRHTFLKQKCFVFKTTSKWLEKLYHKWQLENSSKAQWW
jgi:hypothetical protein